MIPGSVDKPTAAESSARYTFLLSRPHEGHGEEGFETQISQISQIKAQIRLASPATILETMGHGPVFPKSDYTAFPGGERIGGLIREICVSETFFPAAQPPPWLGLSVCPQSLV